MYIYEYALCDTVKTLACYLKRVGAHVPIWGKPPVRSVFCYHNIMWGLDKLIKGARGYMYLTALLPPPSLSLSFSLCLPPR